MRHTSALLLTKHTLRGLVFILAYILLPSSYAKAPTPSPSHYPDNPHNNSHNNLSPSPNYQPLAFKILQAKEHAPKAFTQGWAIDNAHFYESSGLYGKSYVVRYNRDNLIAQKYTLPKHLFAEGLTLFNEELYLLSWQKGIALVFDPETLQLKRSHNYHGEGWGLTHNGIYLIMSNGSNQLHLRDAKTFKIKHTLTVQGGSYNWQRLNELEFAKGLIWANIWQTPFIAAIDPNTGTVMGTVNLDKLVKANTQQPKHQSLNGIAYDAKYDAFWVTGKHWPKRYLIKIQIPKNAN